MHPRIWLLYLTLPGRFGRIHSSREISHFHGLSRPDALMGDAGVLVVWLAVTSSLSLIGSLALYPLLFIDQEVSALAALPGVVATVVPMIAMHLLPMWPAHKVIKARKAQEIARVNAQLDDLGSGPGSSPDRARLEQINNLLDHRIHLQRVSDWPFDISSLSRLTLYLIIPPLTWVGAALIENAVDALL